MNDAIEDDLWQQLRFVQKMRNGIVHGGITVDVKDARNALETIRAVVDKFDTALGSVETEPSS